MNKIIFIDRDGTLIHEPQDFQVDCLEKIALVDNVIPALIQLKNAGFKLVMVTNQDGLGSASFPQENFDKTQAFMLQLFSSQGITFESVHICPHFENEACTCRKPAIGLLMDYVINRRFDVNHSYVVGDRLTDMQLATNLKIKGFQLGGQVTWDTVARDILCQPRVAEIKRETNETRVQVLVNLDETEAGSIQSPCNFLNHMLEQIAKHAAIRLDVRADGDIAVDDHHCVEDIAICLGQAIRKALGDKRGIERYAFTTPMDESLATVVMDLCGRAECRFRGNFTREKVGDLSTELVAHFFKTLSLNMEATLHVSVKGENNHHMIEACFKAFGRALKQAKSKAGYQIASTKGCL